MLKNYFKMAFRTFKKDKSFTAIKVLGLAAGLAITLMIVQHVRYEMSYEHGYPNADRIVRITTHYLNGENVFAQDVETFPVLSEVLKNEIPEIENSTRAYPIGKPSIDIQIGLKQKSKSVVRLKPVSGQIIFEHAQDSNGAKGYEMLVDEISFLNSVKLIPREEVPCNKGVC